jgi:hypothetical protein
MTVAADAEPDNKRRSDEARAALERSRSLREQMLRSGGAVVDHLRRAAEIRRQAGRSAR